MMNMNDFIRMECTSCGAVIYAEKGLGYWYCGHCGEQIKVTPPAKKKPVVIKLKKHTAPAPEEGTAVKAEQSIKAPEAVTAQKPAPASPELPKAPAPVPEAPAKEAPKAPAAAPAPAKEEPKASEAAPASDSDKKPDVPEFEMDLITLKKYHGDAIDLELPASIRKIGPGAFKGNTQLRSIVIPDSVMDIARSAFEDCTELKSVTLPGSLTKIDYKTFNNCKNLKSLSIPGTVVEIAFESLHCGLEELIIDNPKTSWDVDIADSAPAFIVDRKGDGNGVSRIIFRGTEYNAAEVFRYGSMEAYFRSKGLCPRCGGQYNILKRCKNCNWKREQ